MKLITTLLALVTLALFSGCNIEATSKYYPIHKAAQKGDITAIQELLDKGEDINRKSHPAKNTPLISAVAGRELECCKFLIEKGANHSHAGLFGAEARTALQLASLNGSTNIVNYFLSQGIGPDEKSGSYTAFHYACRNGHLDVAKALLKAGADVNGMNRRGGNPLRSAVNLKQDRIFYWLLEKGADVNAQSPLYMAVYKEDLEKVKVLVGKDADINVVCLYGTPLMIAVKKGRVDISEHLLKNGATTTYPYKDKTVDIMETAEKLGKQDMIDLLAKYEEKPNN